LPKTPPEPVAAPLPLTALRASRAADAPTGAARSTRSATARAFAVRAVFGWSTSSERERRHRDGCQSGHARMRTAHRADTL